MMVVRLFPLFCQADIDHSSVLGTPLPDHILFIDKTVHGGGKRSDSDFQFFCDCRHIVSFSEAHRFNNMHIVVRNVLIFFCDHCFSFQLPDFIEQMNQDFVDCPVCVHVFLLLYLSIFRLVPILLPSVNLSLP